jgi:hypothetical protein
VEPEADQEVRGEADELPADEEREQAVADEDAEHRGGEQAEEAEEPRGIRVLLHVAKAEDKDQGPDERDHHAHERRQRVEQPAEAHGAVGERGPQREAGDDERANQAGDGRPRRHSQPAARRERAEARREQGQERDEPELFGGDHVSP